MRIRENHSVGDRIKVLLVLVFVLFVLGGLSKIEDSNIKKSVTIQDFLKTALEPVGSTMYIWGGGWDDTDRTSGSTSTQIGLSPEWKRFANVQNAEYDFREHRFEREKGLDCSGYVGWVLYNTFESMDGKPGYVTTSTNFAESLAGKGWGELLINPRDFLPGDIVSMEGHVWICLGTCEDGSVLLVHSSPPGVSVCGTKSNKVAEEQLEREESYEGEKSIAVSLAEEYMKTHHPTWQERYPNRYVADSYLKNVKVFRWNQSTMSDVQKIQGLSAEEILERIFGFHEIS